MTLNKLKLLLIHLNSSSPPRSKRLLYYITVHRRVVNSIISTHFDIRNIIIQLRLLCPRAAVDENVWVLPCRIIFSMREYDVNVGTHWRHQIFVKWKRPWTTYSYIYLHVISWPYVDIVSALTVGGHLLSLVRRCLTLCQMIYEILQSAHRLSDSRWRLIFSLPISTFSALGVSHVMRSINVRYLLAYLLT